MYKILLCDPLSGAALDLLKEAPDVQLTENFGMSEDQIIESVKPFNAVIVRSATKITKKIIENAENLKVMRRAGSGLDNIDVSAADEKGIKVLNTPGTNAPAVAEMTIGFLFALARNIPAADRSMKDGLWLKKNFPGSEISGKTLGIIGCGKIGSIVAQKAFALGVDIMVYSRSKVSIPHVTFEQVAFEKLIAKADFISIHLPKSDSTLSMISENEFKKMKNTVFLINTSRDGIVCEKDLLTALDDGLIAGAALDVFENEPKYNTILAKHPKVIATPHIAAASVESQERVGVLIVDLVLEYLRSKFIFL